MIGRDGLDRERLLDAVERAGGADPVSFITTGNVAFTCAPDEVDPLVADLERRISEIVGRPTPVFVRTLDHLRRLFEREPFADQPFGDESVGGEIAFADRPFAPLPEGGLRSRRGDWVVFAVDGADAFSTVRLVDGRTSSPGGALERHHGHPITSRAPGTIERIVRRES
jgi:hypothetical protein